MAALITRAVLFDGYVGALDFWKLLCRELGVSMLEIESMAG